MPAVPGMLSGPTFCKTSIWRVADDGSDLRRLTDGGSESPSNGEYDDGVGDVQPSWSPDGTTILFGRGIGILSGPTTTRSASTR